MASFIGEADEEVVAIGEAGGVAVVVVEVSVGGLVELSVIGVALELEERGVKAIDEMVLSTVLLLSPLLLNIVEVMSVEMVDCLLQVVVKAFAICFATTVQSYDKIVPPPNRYTRRKFCWYFWVS